MKKQILRNAGKMQQYIISCLIVIVVASTCFIFSNIIGYHITALLLLVTVSFLAITFDILPVLVSAILSAFIWDFFFIPPRFAIHVETTEDTIFLVMYFIIAMVSGVLTYKIRKAEKNAQLKEEKANSVKLYNTILNSLSHELRTPLAAIIGASDNLLANQMLTKDDQQLLVGEISKAALRLNQQVENLLNISRLESGHIQPKSDWTDITELVHQTVKNVEENNPGRRISISVHPAMPLCNMDKGMLEQIIYNLLNNAAIHTVENCKIEITALCIADQLQIIIEDGGAGFSNKHMKDVFNKFARDSKSMNAGSGLGLSIVKGFTDALSGLVELEKSHFGGAKFTITIPVKTLMLK